MFNYCFSDKESHSWKYWILKNISIRDPVGTDSDDDVLARFGETIKFDTKSIGLGKQMAFSLTDNYKISEDRMKSLVRRLQTDSKLLQGYDDTIKQQLKQGVIEMIDDNKESKFDNNFFCTI